MSFMRVIGIVGLLLLSLFLVGFKNKGTGIYNPGSNTVGNYQGIINANTGSTLACTYTPVTSGTQNVAYTGATPSASGGAPAYTFSETGALPTGLSINTSTGVISGTPSVNGSFPGIQVQVADTVPTTVNCGASFTLVIAAPPFQGAGDIVASAIVWGSCARVYDAALASTSTSLCDLVDSAAPTVVICTLRGTSSGFVDLAGAYCTGSVTPATKCAAATGGHCLVAKLYDQTGTGHLFSTVTAAAMPTLTFSALNGLPGMTCSTACVFPTGNITQAEPFSTSFVSERTGAFTTQQNVLSISGGTVTDGFGGSTNTALISAGASYTAPATDSAFHAIQALHVAVTCSLVVEGSATTGGCGNNGLSATPLRFGSANGGGSGLTGIVMEVGMWPGAFTPTQYGNLNTNQHSATSGYNF